MRNFKFTLDRRLGDLLLLNGILCGASWLSAAEEGAVSETAASSATATPSAASAPKPSRQSNSEDTAGVQNMLDGFNLQSGAIDWRGKQFNLGDVEMAQARFEKYLNSPPMTTEDDLTYDTLLAEISYRLIGKGADRSSSVWAKHGVCSTVLPSSQWMRV